MEFFHFGPGDALFGSYVPSASSAQPARVVVLCYPFGQEYMRAHRAFRQIAVLLARKGVPVFRFDYAGTGDSAGMGSDAKLGRWIDDARHAITEARRRSGATQVKLAGLRLGGTIAALAAEGRDDVEQLVLWDPVVRGRAFLEDLARQAGEAVGNTWWVNGFPVSAALRTDLESVDLCATRLPDHTRVMQVTSHADTDFTALAGTLRHHAGEAETRVVASPWDWNYMDAVGGILIPRDMVRAIVDVLAT